mmetsp:Transcript_50860/g.123898  ORF Transcript_50860/g.123898 Transcript_50860/m.123898 type:complete len:257 (-) Transcript_50860:25-795(-)
MAAVHMSFNFSGSTSTAAGPAVITRSVLSLSICWCISLKCGPLRISASVTFHASRASLDFAAPSVPVETIGLSCSGVFAFALARSVTCERAFQNLICPLIASFLAGVPCTLSRAASTSSVRIHTVPGILHELSRSLCCCAIFSPACLDSSASLAFWLCMALLFACSLPITSRVDFALVLRARTALRLSSSRPWRNAPVLLPLYACRPTIRLVLMCLPRLRCHLVETGESGWLCRSLAGLGPALLVGRAGPAPRGGP